MCTYVCSERLASCKPRRQDPYSFIPEESQQREMGLPTAVLFTGSSLVGANPLRITEQPTTQNTATASARDTELTQPTNGQTPASSSSLPKWQKPPPSVQAVSRTERLPQLVNHTSDPQGLSRGRQNGEKQTAERGEGGRGGMWPSVSCDSQVSNMAATECVYVWNFLLCVFVLCTCTAIKACYSRLLWTAFNINELFIARW